MLLDFPSNFWIIKQIQTQGCQQVADEAEREYKKMSERITEGREAMKVNLPLSAITFHKPDPI